MREILFKSKRKDNETWISGGSLMHTIEGMYILPTGNNVTINKTTNTIISLDVCEIIPETLSQYIGMKDKNGTKIFDGDIVKIWEHEIFADKGNWECDNKKFLVCYDKDDGTPEILHKTDGVFIYKWAISNALMSKNNKQYKLEVIGNIWDNPELLSPEIVKKLQNC